MDALFHHSSKRLPKYAIESAARASADSSAELLMEAYNEHTIQYNAKQTNAEREKQIITQALLREEIQELSRLLLLEIRLLSTITRYYQRFNYGRHSCRATPLFPHHAGYYNAPNKTFTYENSYPNVNPDEGQTDQPPTPAYTGTEVEMPTEALDQVYPVKPTHKRKPIWSAVHHVGVTAATIIKAARHNIGRPVWAVSKFASLCQGGYEGCAATVSELLEESGVNIIGSACVSGLVNQLSKLGWHKIQIIDKNQFHPGDIVYGLKETHAHIGIISQVNGNQVLVCDNSSSSGTLKERSIESGGSFTPNGRFAGHLYVMRKES